ncbi:MAG: hypothetical protein JW804_07370 [Sedimentisphaerales bacterium]|nr:hypothetical protein [Sedimentisphaerales bacterium]
MTLSSRRAKYLSIASLFSSVVFFILILILGKWSGFGPISHIGFYLLSTALIWFVLAIQFHQRSLAEQEKLDMKQLASDQSNRTIFEEGMQDELFAVAQKRLTTLEKWFIPVFGGVIAIYQIGIGLYLLYQLKNAPLEAELTRQPLLCAVFMVAFAFAGFLLSKYATGMATQNQYKPLRAGGSSLFGAAILCFILAVCLALVTRTSTPLAVFSYIIPGLLVILGTETALNSILDIYRPRFEGQYSRAAFDSRFLGILNEPGEILHTVAGAIDYQFGFKVSQTWFYKLLEEAIVPLILFSAIILYLLSCIVVINPDEQAIVERFGNPLTASGQVRLIEPGLSLKMPWPIDIVYRYPVDKINEIPIGYKPKKDKSGKTIPEKHLLWGQEHYELEEVVMVASRQTGQAHTEGTVPVSLINANVPVQYKVKRLYDFVYNHENPEQLLEAICYRELARFAASATVEVETDKDLEKSILGSGRAIVKKTLTERIQQQADQAGLGIDVVFVGIQGIHPPVKVAADYQAVVGAVQKKHTEILKAHTIKNVILSRLAGSVEKANELYDLAMERDRVEKQDPAKARQISKQLDDSFDSASGQIFETLRMAKSLAFEESTLAKARGQSFADHLKAYKTSPQIYKRQLRLNMFNDALKNIRKYVVVTDEKDLQVFIVNLRESITGSLFNVAGLEEPEEQ